MVSCDNCEKEKSGSKEDDPFVQNKAGVWCMKCWDEIFGAGGAERAMPDGGVAAAKPVAPTDTAYIGSYDFKNGKRKAVVIASNPIQARRKLRDHFGLYQGSPEPAILGTLREVVKAAEIDGAADLP